MNSSFSSHRSLSFHQSVPSELASYLSDDSDAEQHSQAEWVGMEGWLYKRQDSFPHSWQRRWVVLNENNLMWSDRMIHIGRSGLERERHRWNKTFDIKYFTNIRGKIPGDREQRRFMIVIKREKVHREYLFRAQAKDEKEEWVETITKHMEHYQKQLHKIEEHPEDALYLRM